MPGGKVEMFVLRKKTGVNPDKIFEAMRKGKSLDIVAETRGNEKRHWRPQGPNTYTIKIIAIERDPKFEYCFKARGVLLAMNGDAEEHPSNMSWTYGGPRYEVGLTFYSYNNCTITFSYKEYLTL